MPARLALVDGGETRISEVTVLFFLHTHVTGTPPGLRGQGETGGVLAPVATSPDPLRESRDTHSFGNRELNSAWAPSHSAPCLRSPGIISAAEPVPLTMLHYPPGILSAFLDNVTVVMLMGPLTISLAHEIDRSPKPFYLSAVRLGLGRSAAWHYRSSALCQAL